MGFVLSKVIWPVVTPSNLLAIVLVLGAALALTRWRRLGRRLLLAVAAAVFPVMICPVDEWLMAPLEHRFAAPADLPERVDGIIVLGGAMGVSKMPTFGNAQLSQAADRFTALIILARRYPDARVVFTSGNASLAGGPREADIAAALLSEMAIALPNLVFERNSRTTYENALLSKALANPRPGETWLLVTSALHMPRSVGVFRHQGWDTVPFPVDFETDGSFSLIRPARSLSSRLGAIDRAAREWGGLVAYRLFGYSASLFPGPTP